MREILFRGEKQNGEWLYGDLVHYGDKILIFSENAQNSPDYYEVIHETVGQFTGLTDKNGVKIFEGDIVLGSSGNIKYLVHYDSGNIRPFMLEHSLVIGNIYENQELLK